MLNTIWTMILENKGRYELIDERQDLAEQNGCDALYLYIDQKDGSYLSIGFNGEDRACPTHIEFHKTVM